MMAFLSLLQNSYGGVESYIKQFLGLSDEDIRAIRNTILVSTTSHL
jgi:hypothetical protein